MMGGPALKRCPKCSEAFLQTANFCANCGYRFSAPPTNTVALQPQPYKVCPSCQQRAALTVPQCLRCGHVYRTQFQPPADQTQAIYSPYLPDWTAPGWTPDGTVAPNYANIVGMWLITAGTIPVFSLMGLGAAMLLDLFAVILAIILVNSRSAADRANGWTKLGLEGIGFVAGFLAATSRHSF